MRERVIEEYLYRCIKVLGGLPIKLTSSGHRGLPDRLCVMRYGILIWVECKAPGRKPSALQKVVIAALKERKQLVIVIDSKSQVDALCAWIRGEYDKKQLGRDVE